MKIQICAGLILTLAACVPETETTTGGMSPSGVFTIPDPDDPCGAATVQFLVGKPEARLMGRRYAAPLRIVHPEDKISDRDVNPNRLTARVSADGRVASLTCD